jgi:hypothetical protein
MPHDRPEKPPSHKDSLMGELESIKDLLDKDAGPTIPTLDDSIADSTDSPMQELKLDSIFDDLTKTESPTLADNPTAIKAPETLIPTLEDQPANKMEPQLLDLVKPPTTADANSNPQTPERTQQPDFSIELLIQEIVDEYIPHIEAELRERLSQCEPEMIRQLAYKKVSS